MDSWIELLQVRHSFSATGLPLRLNPRVRVDMNLNPDDADLRAIAVNSPPINSSYISTDADRKENSKSSLKGAVSKKKRRFVMDGFDLDLCLANGTLVRRFGSKDVKVEDIHVGDELVGSSGDAVKARAVVANCISEDMYRIDYAHGSHTVTPHHLVVMRWQRMPSVTVSTESQSVHLSWNDRSTLAKHTQIWPSSLLPASIIGREKEFALWWLSQAENAGLASPLRTGDTVIKSAHTLPSLLSDGELRSSLVIPMHRNGSVMEKALTKQESPVISDSESVSAKRVRDVNVTDSPCEVASVVTVVSESTLTEQVNAFNHQLASTTGTSTPSSCMRTLVLSLFDGGMTPQAMLPHLQSLYAIGELSECVSSATQLYRLLQSCGRQVHPDYRVQSVQADTAVSALSAVNENSSRTATYSHAHAHRVSFEAGRAEYHATSAESQSSADVVYMMHNSTTDKPLIDAQGQHSNSIAQLEEAWGSLNLSQYVSDKIVIAELNPLAGLTSQSPYSQSAYDDGCRSIMTSALLSKAKSIIAFGPYARERWLSDASLLTGVVSVQQRWRSDMINSQSLTLTMEDGTHVQVILAQHPSINCQFDSVLEAIAEAHNQPLTASQLALKNASNLSCLVSVEKVAGGLFTKIEVDAADEQFVLSDGAVTHNTYITNRIIAMGFPSDGTEAIYRNDMVDVQRFFNTRHTDHYKVYNLCSERKYDHAKFNGSVLEVPFDDHNCVSFEDIPFFCKDVADFLSAAEKNVVVVHCKAGKGRTGLLICVFLLYCGEWQTASEALRFYAFARTQNQKGVTIASQIRWIHYWEKYLHLSREGIGLPKLEPLAIKKMVFGKKSPSFDYFIATCHGEIFSSKDKDLPIKIKENKLKDGAYELEFIHETPNANHSQPFVFLKDFQFEFFKGKLFGGSARVMSFWLHTQFLAMEPNYYLKMERMDIDKVSKTKGIPDFTLELFFEPVTVGRKVQEAKSKKNELSSGKYVLDPSLPPIPASVNAETNEMLTAALTMMLEGRKMNRFYLGNKELKEKEVEKKEVFVFLKADGDSEQVAQLPNEQRNFTLYWCADSQQLGGGDKISYEKLAFKDIDRILVGKQTDIWARSVSAKQAAEENCFSVIPKAGSGSSELHLEGFSSRQLALWLEGFKYIATSTGGSVKEDEGEAFQQSLLALTVGKIAASSPSAASSSSSSSSSSAAPAGAGASEGPRERCETFARPPPIAVPQYKSRKIIQFQPKA